MMFPDSRARSYSAITESGAAVVRAGRSRFPPDVHGAHRAPPRNRRAAPAIEAERRLPYIRCIDLLDEQLLSRSGAFGFPSRFRCLTGSGTRPTGDNSAD
ncbi:hypothetical protein [uncultured Salipiger sp.]|uniref:Uncharacterized protein n=1 Tax=Aquibium pacificus TaxID=3153579 RepID=A0ABV3SIW0_9HYPH|nr:hypothetical protein [uncultured Salipiger sp.]